MMQQNRVHLRELRRTHAAAVDQLELQIAAYGPNAVPSHLVVERDDRLAKIKEIDRVLEPPPISPEVLAAMDAVDRHLYIITLVMELQATFLECRSRLARTASLWAVLGATAATLLAKIVEYGAQRWLGW